MWIEGQALTRRDRLAILPVMLVRPVASAAPTGTPMNAVLLGAALAVSCAGCGGNGPPPRLDGALPVPPSCGVPGTVDDGQSVELDPDLAAGVVPVRCPDGFTYFGAAPAQAFRYEVAIGSNRAVTFSTANDQTAVATDTVIAVFDGDCDAGRVAIACFDDTRSQGRFERRASGTVLAGGGTRLTVVVGYYTDTGSLGDVTLDVSSRENRAPDITDAETLFLEDRVLFWANATDPDGDTDVTTLEIAFVGALGELVQVDGYATQRVDAVRVGGRLEATLGVVDVPIEVRGVLVRAVDAAGVPSESSVTAFRSDGAFVGVSEPCDGAEGPAICLGELECASSGPSAGTCQPGATVTAACSTASAVPLGAGMGETRVGTTSVTIEPGAGFLRYPFEQCPEGDIDSFPPRTQGREAILSVTIPEGRWDLLAETSGGMDLDTILYFRTTCGDPESTLGCNDDVDFGTNNYYSALEVRDLTAPPAGRTGTLVAELWDGPTGTMGETFDVGVTLRPVRASGETCDSGFRLDRCEGTPCRAGTCP